MPLSSLYITEIQIIRVLKIGLQFSRNATEWSQLTAQSDCKTQTEVQWNQNNRKGNASRKVRITLQLLSLIIYTARVLVHFLLTLIFQEQLPALDRHIQQSTNKLSNYLYFDTYYQ